MESVQGRVILETGLLPSQMGHVFASSSSLFARFRDMPGKARCGGIPAQLRLESSLGVCTPFFLQSRHIYNMSKAQTQRLSRALWTRMMPVVQYRLCLVARRRCPTFGDTTDEGF